MKSESDVSKHLLNSCKSIFTSFGFRGGARKVSLKLDDATLQLVYKDGGQPVDGGALLAKFNYSFAIYFDCINKYLRLEKDVAEFQTIKSDVGGFLVEAVEGEKIPGDMWVRYSSCDEVDNKIAPAVRGACLDVIKRAHLSDYFSSGKARWRAGDRSTPNATLRLLCVANFYGDEDFIEEVTQDVGSSGSSQTLRSVNEVLQKIGRNVISRD